MRSQTGRGYYFYHEALSLTRFGDSIAHVIRIAYMRLGDRLSKDKGKNTLFANYSDLVANRCKEGITLGEVVMVFQFIKGAIWYGLKNQIAPGKDLQENEGYGKSA
jgi:hypothetical protein